MLKCVCGFPGHGKSLYALYVMLEGLKAGFDVATNIKLLDACPFKDRVIYLDDDKYPVFRLPRKERMLNGKLEPAVEYKAFWHYMPPRVLYVLDELDKYMDSADFMKLHDLADDASAYLTQHEKFGDEIVWIAQNVQNAWVRLRRMTPLWVSCQWNRKLSPVIASLPISMSRFIRAEYVGERMAESDQIATGHFTYREASMMFGWYRRTQLLGDGVKLATRWAR